MPRTPAPSPIALVTGAAPLPAPPNRGRLWYDFQIPDQFFHGLPMIKAKLRWVREHLPRAKRVKIGGNSAWYEADIHAYVSALQEENRAKSAAGGR